ncbi:redoxin domain-containing protein [Paenibacillus mesotrionivorans]|uniref:Redoxin domain-containing protein n=1 Tax=Paenibacillus mesotrionivorans TaxID=3160968 RepID=A0ACC7NSL5_9BACL
MKSGKQWLQIAVLAVVVLAGGLAIGNALFNRGQIPHAGDKAPPFQVADLEGGRRSLGDWSGKPLVLSFWGTFCPPCTEEMPALQNQAAKWAEQGVGVVGMNLGENAVTVRSFIQQYGIRFPIYMDVDDIVRKAYGVNQYPTTFFIRPDGRIHKIIMGKMDEATIDSSVEAMLALP